MANYTDTELENAVSALVQSDVRTERTDLGPQSTDTTWQEVRDLASSTLVFDPSAIFYLLSLAANRVNQDVESAIESLTDLITAIQEMGAVTKKVTRTSLLSDAAAAVLEAERLLTEKQAIADRPYARYNRSIEQFEETSLTPNVRRSTGSGFPNTYEISRPPQKAQEAIKTDISELAELHSEIVGEAEQLTEAMVEFLAAELPKIAIQQSLVKVREDILAIKNEFDGATDDGAIGFTRDAFLRLRAGLAVTNNLRTVADPREPRMQGTSATTDRARAAYDSSTSSSTPARTQTSLGAPYYIEPGVSDTLVLAVDGGADLTATLVPDEPANLVGQNGENYDFHDAQAANLVSSFAGPYTIPAYPDNRLDVYIDGVGYYAYLTAGSRTAGQVAVDLNGAIRIDGEPGILSAVALAADDGSSKLKITHQTVGEGDIVIGDRSTTNFALGFADNLDSDDSDDTRGVDANNVLKVVVDNRYEETIDLGSAVTALNVVEAIDALATYLAAEVTTVPKISGVITTVKLKSKTYGGSALRFNVTDAVHQNCLEVLGFLNSEEAAADYVSLEDLEDALEVLPGVDTERSETLVQGGNDGVAIRMGSEWALRLPSGTITFSPTTSDILLIKVGPNAGYYQISSISLGGTHDYIKLSRAFRATLEAVGDEARNQVWELRRDLLIIKSEQPNTTSSMEVKTANANSAIGLTVGTTVGTTSGLEVVDGGKTQSFERNDVGVGDVVQIGASQYQVTAVTGDGHRLELTPEVSDDLSNATYAIYSAGALAYEDFIEELETWFESLEASQFKQDILELQRRLNPLILNTNPSSARINDAYNSANSLLALYNSLSAVLENFVLSPVPRIDALLNMLEERGLKNAHDLLLLGEFDEFFALNKDSASYGGNLLEKMRAIAQNDVPANTDPDQNNVDSRLEQSYEDTDADTDFTDQDDESGAYEFDDSPRFDDEDDLVEETL